MTKDDIKVLVKEMIGAWTCHPDLKAAGQAWLYELGKDGEAVAAQNLIEEIKLDLNTVEKLIAFAESGNVEKVFDAEVAKKFYAHLEQLKASHAKYCDCDACVPALKILQNKEVVLG